MNKIIHQQFLFDFVTVTIEITTVDRFPVWLTEVSRRFSVGLHGLNCFLKYPPFHARQNCSLHSYIRSISEFLANKK